jgi:large subunit ribosomal protein L33
MAKKKGDKRIKCILNCTECVKPGLFRYYTQRNRLNTPNKLELRKYCPICRHVTLFKESK